MSNNKKKNNNKTIISDSESSDSDEDILETSSSDDDTEEEELENAESIISDNDSVDDDDEEEEDDDKKNIDDDKDNINDNDDKDKNYNKKNKNEDKYDETDNCYSKDLLLDDEEINFDDINDVDDIIKKNGRMTKPFLEKYEVVKLLAVRSKQIAQGAKPMIKNCYNMSHKEIAKEELKLKVMPLILVRPIPNSEPEKWYLRELDYSKIMSMIDN